MKLQPLEEEDDAEDVSGGLNAGLKKNWRSNARYDILIADPPRTWKSIS